MAFGNCFAVSLRVSRTAWAGSVATTVSLVLAACCVLLHILSGGFLYFFLPHFICPKCAGLAFTILAMSFLVGPVVVIAVATPFGVHRFLKR